MEPIKTFTGKIAAIPITDIDTDQIIPASYLRAISKDGMAEGLFANWRYDAQGNPNADFVLNRAESHDAQILVAGNNFGCGSSREHAVWALQGYGFKAIISTSFANIFYNNALKMGLLPIAVDEGTYEQLVSLFEEEPSTTVTVDLANQTVTLPDGRKVGFPLDGFSKHCLLNGLDQLGFLMSDDDAIAAYEGGRAQRVNTLA